MAPQDPLNGPGMPSGRPPYAQHQLMIYINALVGGPPRLVTTDPCQLEAEAQKHMTPQSFDYVCGSAGSESTARANIDAFSHWRIVPRFLRPTLPRDLTVRLFGQHFDSPVLMAPVGVQTAYHADGEKGAAAACAELGVPYVLSTASGQGLEAVCEAADEAWRASAAGAELGGRAPRWFQLYWPASDDITASLLARAKKAGCTALVVTLDTFTMAWRPRDLDHGYLPFASGEGCAMGLEDPVFQRMFSDANDGEKVEDNVTLASRAWMGEAFSGQAHSWAELPTLRKLWGEGPILLKGVLSVQDAVLARRWGVDGVVVSNHGGRQLDGAVASLEVLPEIVDAVGETMTVLFDSGIRTGSDIVKALALGARAVLVGRPVIYGLGIAGREGAREVLAGILTDLDQSMGLAGVKSVAELNRGMLRRSGLAKPSL